MDEKRWREVWEAFRAAIELPASERRAYARSAITDPEELNELLALLANEESAKVSGSPLIAPDGTGTDEPPRQEWARLGQTSVDLWLRARLVAAAWGRSTSPATPN